MKRAARAVYTHVRLPLTLALLGAFVFFAGYSWTFFYLYGTLPQWPK